MLTWIYELLKSIVVTAIALVNLIINTIKSIIGLFIMLPNYVQYIGLLVNVMPVWIQAFILGILTISIAWAIRRAF